MGGTTRPLFQPMKSTSVHPALFDRALNDYVDQTASRYCRKDRETWKEMRQEAWLWISLCYDDADMDTFKRIAYNAIRNYYNALRKEDYISFEAYFSARTH